MSRLYGTFQIAKHIVKIPRAGATIKIVPFGDIHRDSHNCDVDRWKAFLEKCKTEDDEYTWYIGMGDYNDFASYSERKALHTLHESTCVKMDDWAMRDVDTLLDELSFMKGRIIGLHHGNHEWKFQDGRLASEVMADELGCPFLGYASHSTLAVKTSTKGQPVDITIFSSHGKGSGRLIGSPYNTVEKMANIFHDEDIYLMGHDHMRGALPRTRLCVENGIVKQKKQFFGRTGSFLKGWVKDEPSYVVGAMYEPTSLGTIKFECKIRRCQKNGMDTMIKDLHHWS
jgi:hypothetical protein